MIAHCGKGVCVCMFTFQFRFKITHVYSLYNSIHEWSRNYPLSVKLPFEESEKACIYNFANCN